ncbi:MAG: deoxyribonuclease [Actinoplanes sp.]|jgi:deoxyribonuclease V|nr:deoxyribonuclease [Actinoplanes sp.]
MIAMAAGRGSVTVPERTRYAAVDVYYPASGGARAALVVAEGPRFDTLVEDRVCWLPEVAEYRPGEFFARELPAVSAVLGEPGELALVVIDGYVDLDPDGRAGLGAHLHAQIHVPVIGVAKTAFHTASHAIAVRRGAATRPLYVTAAGLPIEHAAALVSRMAGPYRLPDALRRVDALSRARQQPCPAPPAADRAARAVTTPRTTHDPLTQRYDMQQRLPL